MKQDEIMPLSATIITSVRSQLGYLQVLEYKLQDLSYLHVVQWHFNSITEKNSFIPIVNDRTFYKSKKSALQFARKIGNDLLKQF